MRMNGMFGRALAWARANLFQSWGNGILTVIAVWLIAKVTWGALDWALLSAVFSGDDGSACSGAKTGACWPFITHKLGLFLYGRYPEAERWRVLVVYALAAASCAALCQPMVRATTKLASAILLGAPVVCFFLLTGGWFGLHPVETELWGGLLVTLIVASVGIAAALPLGLALALGRRSQLPVVRWLSVGFIEIVRGVPLITVLFMASVMLPLFLPPNVTFDKLLRALVGVGLFSAAYMAEVIRGGLQAVPRGQYMAADALGLTEWQKMRLVVLPQALRVAIPGVVNSAISLFKDTSLVLIIGLFDLLGVVQQSVQADAKWFAPSTAATGYVFAAALFWVFCFGMSRAAALLEQRLAHATKR